VKGIIKQHTKLTAGIGTRIVVKVVPIIGR